MSDDGSNWRVPSDSGWQHKAEWYEKRNHELTKAVLGLKKLSKRWRGDHGILNAYAWGRCADDLDAKIDELGLECDWVSEDEKTPP